MNPAAPKPLYVQLADELRRQIREGEMNPGDRFPSELDLAEESKVTRETVRRALGLLRTEGLVHTGASRGTYVSERGGPLRFEASVVHAQSAWERTDRDAFQTALAETGRTGHEEITVERRMAPEDITVRLGLEEGEEVIVRRRVQHVDGHPSGLEDSWYPARLVEGTEIATPADVARGTNRVLAEIGHGAVRRTDEITPRMPTNAEAQTLQIAGGVPVQVIVGTEYDAEDVPVEVAVRVKPSDRHVLVYEVRQDV